MTADDFGTLASVILSDNFLCQHLREAPDNAEFWRRLETLAHERGLHPDFEAARANATAVFTFWLMHWSGDGVA